MAIYNIASNFTEYPGLRHCSISEYSGEEFYHSVLNKLFVDALNNGEKLIINIDGTTGYASSFLDEAFGNLVYDFSLKVVKDTIEIVSLVEPHWKKMIEDQSFVQWEQRRVDGKAPIVTKIHDPWFRLVDLNLESKEWARP